MLATVLGIPPAAAVGIALILTALGVLVDLLRLGTLGIAFETGYIAGCALAVAWVRRRGLFGPTVQPPLLIAVTVPAVALLVGAPRPGAGVAENLLMIGAPTVNAFPTMAVTTAAVIAVSVARVRLQPLDRRPAATAARGSGAARGAARRSPSPRRS